MPFFPIYCIRDCSCITPDNQVIITGITGGTYKVGGLKNKTYIKTNVNGAALTLNMPDSSLYTSHLGSKGTLNVTYLRTCNSCERESNIEETLKISYSVKPKHKNGMIYVYPRLVNNTKRDTVYMTTYAAGQKIVNSAEIYSDFDYMSNGNLHPDYFADVISGDTTAQVCKNCFAGESSNYCLWEGAFTGATGMPVVLVPDTNGKYHAICPERHTNDKPQTTFYMSINSISSICGEASTAAEFHTSGRYRREVERFQKKGFAPTQHILFPNIEKTINSTYYFSEVTSNGDNYLNTYRGEYAYSATFNFDGKTQFTTGSFVDVMADGVPKKQLYGYISRIGNNWLVDYSYTYDHSYKNEGYCDDGELVTVLGIPHTMRELSPTPLGEATGGITSGVSVQKAGEGKYIEEVFSCDVSFGCKYTNLRYTTYYRDWVYRTLYAVNPYGNKFNVPLEMIVESSYYHSYPVCHRAYWSDMCCHLYDITSSDLECCRGGRGCWVHQINQTSVYYVPAYEFPALPSGTAINFKSHRRVTEFYKLGNPTRIGTGTGPLAAYSIYGMEDNVAALCANGSGDDYLTAVYPQHGYLHISPIATTPIIGHYSSYEEVWDADEGFFSQKDSRTYNRGYLVFPAITTGVGDYLGNGIKLPFHETNFAAVVAGAKILERSFFDTTYNERNTQRYMANSPYYYSLYDKTSKQEVQKVIPKNCVRVVNSATDVYLKSENYYRTVWSCHNGTDKYSSMNGHEASLFKDEISYILTSQHAWKQGPMLPSLEYRYDTSYYYKAVWRTADLRMSGEATLGTIEEETRGSSASVIVIGDEEDYSEYIQTAGFYNLVNDVQPKGTKWLTAYNGQGEYDTARKPYLAYGANYYKEGKTYMKTLRYLSLSEYANGYTLITSIAYISTSMEIISGYITNELYKTHLKGITFKKDEVTQAYAKLHNLWTQYYKKALAEYDGLDLIACRDKQVKDAEQALTRTTITINETEHVIDCSHVYQDGITTATGFDNCELIYKYNIDVSAK